MFKLVNDKGEVYGTKDGTPIHFDTRESATEMWKTPEIAAKYPICTPADSVWKRLLNGWCWTSPSGATH